MYYPTLYAYISAATDEQVTYLYCCAVHGITVLLFNYYLDVIKKVLIE